MEEFKNNEFVEQVAKIWNSLNLVERITRLLNDKNFHRYFLLAYIILLVLCFLMNMIVSNDNKIFTYILFIISIILLLVNICSIAGLCIASDKFSLYPIKNNGENKQCKFNNKLYAVAVIVGLVINALIFMLGIIRSKL